MLRLIDSVTLPDGDYGVWLPLAMAGKPAFMDLTDGSAHALPEGYDWTLDAYGAVSGWAVTRAEPLERRTPPVHVPVPDGIAKGTRNCPWPADWLPLP